MVLRNWGVTALAITVEHAFVMRFWQELGSDDLSDSARWRARIFHVNTQQALHVDGIERAFTRAVDRHADTQAIADALLTKFARESDDALVLVARYLGAENSAS